MTIVTVRHLIDALAEHNPDDEVSICVPVFKTRKNYTLPPVDQWVYAGITGVKRCDVGDVALEVDDREVIHNA